MPRAGQPLDDGRFGPPVEGGRVRRGGPDWRRLGLIAVSGVCVLALVVGLGVGGAILYGSQRIERVDVPELSPAGEPPRTAPAGRQEGEGDGGPEVEEITEVLNVLVVGSDSRAGLTDEQLQALGTEESDGLRTDTIMLLQLDPRREGVAVLSFPRDLLLTRCDGTRGRINAAYGIGEESGLGGARCLVQTVAEHTGIPINHFVQVDFAGFIDIVDALGGVSLYLDEPIRDPHAGADFPAGCVTMTGSEALSFVRVRHIDSDFGRIARQQRFLREVVDEAASVGTLVNVPRLFSLVDAAARAVETDRDLSLLDMRRIAFSLRDIGADQLDTRVVPAHHQVIDGAAYVVQDDEEAEALFEAFRTASAAPEGVGVGETADPPAAEDGADADEADADEAEPDPAVEVADVAPVTVLNGAGVRGLAGTASEQLEEEGFEVASAGNAPRFDVDRTEVTHAPGQAQEAALVAAALGGAELTADPDHDGGPVAVLGADWEPGEVAEVQRPRERPSPTPTPTPTASPTPEPEETFAGAEPSRSC